MKADGTLILLNNNKHITMKVANLANNIDVSAAKVACPSLGKRNQMNRLERQNYKTHLIFAENISVAIEFLLPSKSSFNNIDRHR